MRVKTSPLFKLARVLVCVNRVASGIVKANHNEASLHYCRVSWSFSCDV